MAAVGCYFLVSLIAAFNVQTAAAFIPVYTKKRGDCNGNDIGCASGLTFPACKQTCDVDDDCLSFFYAHYPTNLDGHNVLHLCCAKFIACLDSELTFTAENIHIYYKNATHQSCNQFLAYTQTCTTNCSFTCPVGCTGGVVWGDVYYTTDSDVCTAAIHAGVTTSAGGGTVYVRRQGANSSFTGSTRNGVTSLSDDTWLDSFEFSVYVYTKKQGDCTGYLIGNCTTTDNTFLSCKKKCDDEIRCLSFLYGHDVTNLNGTINVLGWCCLKSYQCSNSELNFKTDPVYTYYKHTSRHICNHFLANNSCQPSCSFSCPSGCTEGVIYGDGFYASNSDVCTAAIHVGVIDTSGGIVHVRRINEQSVFGGATRNNIQSTSLSSTMGAFVFDCSSPPSPLHADGAPCTGIVSHNTYCSWNCESGYKPGKPFYCGYGLWQTQQLFCVDCLPDRCGANCTSSCSDQCKDSVCNRFDCNCVDCVDGKGGPRCATNLPAPAANPFTVSEKKDTSFKLSWSQCSEPNNVTGYNLYMTGTDSRTIPVSGKDSLDHNIDSLSEGKTYTVTMSCVNNLMPPSGTPKRSSSINVTTCSVPAVPAIQLTSNLKHGDTKKAEIKVTFHDAEHNCDSITSRIVYKNLDDVGLACSDGTGCVITDLIPYTVYAVRLKIINSGGREATGPTMIITTSEGVPPKPATPINVTTTPSSVTVNITTPDPPHGVITKKKKVPTANLR